MIVVVVVVEGVSVREVVLLLLLLVLFARRVVSALYRTPAEMARSDIQLHNHSTRDEWMDGRRNDLVVRPKTSLNQSLQTIPRLFICSFVCSALSSHKAVQCAVGKDQCRDVCTHAVATTLLTPLPRFVVFVFSSWNELLDFSKDRIRPVALSDQSR